MPISTAHRAKPQPDPLRPKADSVPQSGIEKRMKAFCEGTAHKFVKAGQVPLAGSEALGNTAGRGPGLFGAEPSAGRVDVAGTRCLIKDTYLIFVLRAPASHVRRAGWMDGAMDGG